jgi:hypothetical protein
MLCTVHYIAYGTVFLPTLGLLDYNFGSEVNSVTLQRSLKTFVVTKCRCDRVLSERLTKSGGNLKGTLLCCANLVDNDLCVGFTEMRCLRGVWVS